MLECVLANRKYFCTPCWNRHWLRCAHHLYRKRWIHAASYSTHTDHSIIYVCSLIGVNAASCGCLLSIYLSTKNLRNSLFVNNSLGRSVKTFKSHHYYSLPLYLTCLISSSFSKQETWNFLKFFLSNYLSFCE